MNNKGLFLVGMHRSGTSLVAQWLHKSGLNMGNEFSDDTLGNDDGHFEDLDFLKIHQKALKEKGFEPNGLMSFGKITTLSSETEKEVLRILLGKKVEKYWGMKDPRVCLFLEYYEQKQEENTTFLFLIRDPLIVVDSLIRRDLKYLLQFYKSRNRWLQVMLFKWLYNYRYQKSYRISANQYLNAWCFYNTSILDHLTTISKDRFILLSYKDLIDNESHVVKFLQTRGFDLDYISFKDVFDSKKIKENTSVDKMKLFDQTLLQKAFLLYEELKRYTI